MFSSLMEYASDCRYDYNKRVLECRDRLIGLADKFGDKYDEILDVFDEYFEVDE